MFRFEELSVWHKAIAYMDRVYEITDTFPTNERFGLTSQLRRAAVSISSNIAEGSSRVSNKDFSRFVEIAYGSLCETVSLVMFAKRRNLVAAERQAELYRDAEELARMLSSLRNSLGKWKREQTGSE